MSADIERLVGMFDHTFQGPPTVVSQAPGRINLIGEHTDYNEGLVLPIAVDLTVAVAGAFNRSMSVHVESLEYDLRADFSLDEIKLGAEGTWPNYVRGVAWVLGDAGYSLRGADLLISGGVPQGSGLSSSAALELAVAGAMCAISDIDVEPRVLALLCQKAENEFVGVLCGVMDQLASACSKESQALLIDCRSLATEHIPLPPDGAIVVVDSKVPRSLADTPYNRRREECAEAARMLGLGSLRDADEQLLESKRRKLAEHLYRRARHVVTENARVQLAADALRLGDLLTVGSLLYASHASLRDDFDVSTPELDLLVELARSADGVFGARLTGAGFGGCTVNFIRRDAVDAFRSTVLEPYCERTGLPAEMHVCRSVDGLEVTNV